MQLAVDGMLAFRYVITTADIIVKQGSVHRERDSAFVALRDEIERKANEELPRVWSANDDGVGEDLLACWPAKVSKT